MPTYLARGRAVVTSTGTTWANGANALDGTAGANPATYATWTNATSGGTASFTIGSFDTITYGGGETVTQVALIIRNGFNNAARIQSVTCQAKINGTAVGDLWTLKVTTGMSDDRIVLANVSDAEVRNPGFQVQVIILRKTVTQSAIWSIDHVDLEIDTALPAVTPVASFSANKTTVGQGQTVIFTDTSTNTPTTWAWNFGTGATPATANTKGPHTVTYNTIGTSTVTLTAGNTAGSDPSDPTNITVTVVPKINTTLVEGFDTQIPASWLATSFGSPSWDAGRAKMVEAVRGTYSGIQSTYVHDLNESSVFVKITDINPRQPNSETSVTVWDAAQQNGLAMVSYTETLAPLSIGFLFRKRIAGVNTDATPGVYYDAGTMGFWRIRLTGGTAYFDTSPDATNWTNRYSTAYAPSLSAVGVELAMGQWGTTPATLQGPGYFDNVNIVPAVVTGGKPKVYVGGSWQPKPVKVYLAGSWQEKPMKRWDGSQWKPV